MAQRTPAEIRSSIEANRMELAVSVQKLRGEVARLTDWRAHVERHRSEITVGAAVVGLMVARALLRRRRPPQRRLIRLSSARGIAPTPIRPGPV